MVETRGRTDLFSANEVSPWKLVGLFGIRRHLVTPGVREQRTANPGGLEGVEVKTGWKEFE